jgi:hypothetical protein
MLAWLWCISLLAAAIWGLTAAVCRVLDSDPGGLVVLSPVHDKRDCSTASIHE